MPSLPIWKSGSASTGHARRGSSPDQHGRLERLRSRDPGFISRNGQARSPDKNYVDREVGRYAPPQLIDVNRFNINGINDLGTICTSHVERNNLTIRTFMKRFTRLALGFSKKLENLAAATAIHVAVYNFCRMHSTIRCTPAMAAGVIDQLWSMDDLYSAVTKHAATKAFRKKRDARIAKLIDKLRER